MGKRTYVTYKLPEVGRQRIAPRTRESVFPLSETPLFRNLTLMRGHVRGWGQVQAAALLLHPITGPQQGPRPQPVAVAQHAVTPTPAEAGTRFVVASLPYVKQSFGLMSTVSLAGPAHQAAQALRWHRRGPCWMPAYPALVPCSTAKRGWLARRFHR